ncbi:MAG: prepilin-type N-terminal cleavage/methylation domain-containing protein [Candidatus Omnitrophota bacterium]
MGINNKKGFTFLEMLMSAAMTAVLAVTLYGMLANGLKVWTVVNRESPQLDRSLFFESITEELSNSFEFAGIEFTGDQISFSFPALMKVSGREDGFYEEIGLVRYFYDKNDKNINKQQVSYQQLHQMKKTESREKMKEVESFSLSYYFYDKEKDTFFWSSVWPPEMPEPTKTIGLPQAVHIEMSFKDGVKIEKCSRIITIPSGGLVG